MSSSSFENARGLQAALALQGLSFEDRQRALKVRHAMEYLEAEKKAKMAAMGREQAPPSYESSIATTINKIAELEQRAAMGSVPVGKTRELERSKARVRTIAEENSRAARRQKLEEHVRLYGDKADAPPLVFDDTNDGLTDDQRELLMTPKERKARELARKKKEEEDYRRLRKEYLSSMTEARKKTVNQINSHQVQQQIAWRKETQNMPPKDVAQWHTVRRELQMQRLYQMMLWHSVKFWQLANVAYEHGIPTLMPDGKPGAPSTAPETRCVIEVTVPSESTFHFSRKWVPEITWASLSEIEARRDRQKKINSMKKGRAGQDLYDSEVDWAPGSPIKTNVDYLSSILYSIKTYTPASEFVFNIVKRNDPYDDAVDPSPTPNYMQGKMTKDAFVCNGNIVAQGPLKEAPRSCANPPCGWFLLAGAPLHCDQRCVESVHEVFCDSACRDEHYQKHHKAHWAAIVSNREGKKKKGKERKLKQMQRKREREAERARAVRQSNPETVRLMAEEAQRRTVVRANRAAAVAKLDRDNPHIYLEASAAMRALALGD